MKVQYIFNINFMEGGMGKTYEFLKECEIFYIATINENSPAVRPFGAVMEFEGELYISTGKNKNVYKQFINNNLIQVVALKTGTRDWVRIDGKIVEIYDLNIKQKMLDSCPNLVKRFNKDSEHFALFKIIDMSSVININGEFVKII